MTQPNSHSADPRSNNNNSSDANVALVASASNNGKVLLSPLPGVVKLPKKKFKLGLWLFRLFLLAGVCVAGFFGWQYYQKNYNKELAKPITAKVIRGELKITVGDRGELDSVKAVSVHNELQGRECKLASIIDEGKAVKKGDICCQFDTEPYVKAFSEQEIRYQTAVGKVKTSQSSLEQAKTKSESEINKAELAYKLAKIDLEAYDDKQGEYQKDLEKAKGSLELNRKQLKESEDDLEFTKSMVKDGFIPVQQLRPKEQSVEQRKFEVKASEAELVILEKFTRLKKITELKAKAKDSELELERTKEIQKSMIASAEAELKAAENNEKSEKTTLDRFKEQIDRCTIKAPSDGIIVYSNTRYWDESSRIRPGAQLYFQQEIFTLPDLSNMKVKLKVHESVIKKVVIGLPVTINLDSLPDRPLHGKVTKIGTIAQRDYDGGGVKQYSVECSIDDLPSDAGLKPGMTGMVSVLTKTLSDAISIPVSSVTEFEEMKVVYLVEGNKVTRHEVSVGENNEQFVQILTGLNPGQEVAMDARTRAANELNDNKGKEKGKESEKEKGKEGEKEKTVIVESVPAESPAPVSSVPVQTPTPTSK